MADKKNTSAQPQESVSDILSAIKGIVDGDDGNNNTQQALENSTEDDFLELTDIVEDISELSPTTVLNNENIVEDALSQTVEASPEAKSADSDVSQAKDILDEIDSVLGTDVDDQKAVLEELKRSLDPAYKKDNLQANSATNAAEASVVEPVVNADEFKPISEFDDIIAAPNAPAFEPVSQPIVEATPEVKAIVEATPEIIQPPKMLNPIKTNLLSAEMAQKSHLAIQNLLNNIPKPEILSPAMRNGTTIEDIVVESMKPLLKEWLDQNLETLVRDIVEREIKKLVPHE